jgi:hypothetical protein
MLSIGAAIEQFAEFLLQYFIVLAAAGTLAMAIVELFKKVHDSRTRFHARAVTKWFLDSPLGGDAFGELLHLAAGVPKCHAGERARSLLKENGAMPGWLWLPIQQSDSAFALELERMMTCFQDSVDAALTSPELFKHLFDFATESADPTDRRAWLIEAALPPGLTPPTPQELKDRAERYARLRQAAKRKLDAFQMFTAMRWVNKQQLWANVLGTFILSTAFVVTGMAGDDIVFAAAFSALGGMLAPVAKDVVVALQQVRQPRV